MPMTCTRSSTLRVDTPLMQAAVSAFCAMRRGSRNTGKSLPLSLACTWKPDPAPPPQMAACWPVDARRLRRAT